MARIVVKRGPEVWLLDASPRLEPKPLETTTEPDQVIDIRTDRKADPKPDLPAEPKPAAQPVAKQTPRRTTSDPQVLALATILSDVELWCPDPALRAKLQGSWMIPAAELMLGVRTSDSAPETEWGVRWPALGVVACENEAAARRTVAEQNFGNVTVVSRSVRTMGPWAEPEDDAAH